MVVPHSTGQLVRSMVRVPGSGVDREAIPSCLDLSNVSSLAATVYVPKSLPKALIRPRQSAGTADVASKLFTDQQLDILRTIRDKNRAAQETSGETVSNSVNNHKRALSEPSSCIDRNTSSNPPPKKVARVRNLKPPQLQSNTSVGLVAGQPVQLLLIPGPSSVSLQAQLQQSSGTASPAPVTFQMATVAVQLPTLLVQHQHASNASPMLPGRTQTTLSTTADAAVSVAKSVHVRQVANSISSGIVLPVNLQQELTSQPSQALSQQASLVEQLRQERNRLKEVNKSLQLTLTRYQNLFKNKASLQRLQRYVAEESKAQDS